MKLISIFILLGCSWLNAVSQTPESRKFVHNINMHYAPNMAFGAGYGLEYGIKDKVVYQNNVQVRKKGGYNLVVNQFILGLNAELLYDWERKTSALTSLTAEYRKTTKKRGQIQLGIGPGYIFNFSNPTEQIAHPLEPFLQNDLAFDHGIAPMFFVGFGKFRTGKRVWQFWHLRYSHYALLENAGLVSTHLITLRLGLHRRPLG